MSPKGSIEHSATSRADSAIAEVRNTTQIGLGRADGVRLAEPGLACLGSSPGVSRDGALSQVSPPTSSS